SISHRRESKATIRCGLNGPGKSVKARRKECMTVHFSSKPSLSADHGDALDLDQQAGAREPAHRDERAAGKAVLEYVAADFGQTAAVATVFDDPRHGDHVLQPAAADRLDGFLERVEDFPCLAFEALLGRAGLAAEPDHLAAFGGDGTRKGAFLRARIRRVALLGRGGGSEGARKGDRHEKRFRNVPDRHADSPFWIGAAAGRHGTSIAIAVERFNGACPAGTQSNERRYPGRRAERVFRRTACHAGGFRSTHNHNSPHSRVPGSSRSAPAACK